MELANFVTDLLQGGQVTVAGQLRSFQAEELQKTIRVLNRFYDEEVLDMPGTAPLFAPEAALWGATYLYLAIQLTLLRDVGEETVKAHLPDFLGPVTPSTIYSADLMLRYLPQLLHLAKGLAPDDVLIQCIQQTLRQWPFSSIGADLPGETNQQVILSHPSLKIAYVDRIIRYQDRSRVKDEKTAELVREALGMHGETLWPAFNQLNRTTTDGKPDYEGI